MLLALPLLFSLSCRKTINPEVRYSDRGISAPSRFDDAFQYFYESKDVGNSIMCIDSAIFQMLVIESQRYIKECESCPVWDKGEDDERTIEE